jgi:hypothetical protein
MLSRVIFFLLAVALTFLLVSVEHADARIPQEIKVRKPRDIHAHPWPGGPASFKRLMKRSLKIRPGNYRIRSAVTGEYMTFFSKGNNIDARRRRRNGGSDLGKRGQIFRIAHHKNRKYRRLYSIHRPNASGNDKCISAAYSYVANTYAVMYMCRIETKVRRKGGVTTPGTKLRFDKQIWIFQRGTKKRTFKMVSVAHMDHYKPRCIYPAHSSGYGAMKPHWYQGLALLECKFKGRRSKEFDWRLERV